MNPYCARSPVWLPSAKPILVKGDPTFYGPAPIAVTHGTVTPGIDARMQPGATITGRITNQAGHPVRGACVWLTPVTGAGADGTFGSGAVAGSGSFSAANLAPGQYNVLYSGLFRRHRGCGRSPYADWQFSNRAAGAFPDLIDARGGKVTTGVDAVLALAGQISGVVTDRSGRGLSRMCVQAIGKSNAGTTGSTGRHGTYTLRALAPGRYKVEFTSCRASGGYVIGDLQPGLYKVRFTTGCGASGYATRWYNHASTQRGARVIRVRAATVTPGINATLLPAPTRP